MSLATRLVSRRKPALRLVADDAYAQRHMSVVDVCTFERIVEVITFDEYDRMRPKDRPNVKGAYVLPGLGLMWVRRPISDHEKEDVIDVASQAVKLFEMQRDMA